MDSMPKQAEEPKAPDKNSLVLKQTDKEFNNKLKAVGRLTNNVEIYNECDKTRLSSGQDSSVSSLDESSLKALLEEAMAYKRPKDVQGKSDLFKELLNSVATENKFSGRERPEKPNSKKPRRRQTFGMNRKECDKNSTHGSLQDLAQVHHSSSGTVLDDASKSQNKINLKQQVPSWKQSGQDLNVMNIPYKVNEDYATIIANGNCAGFANVYELQQFVANEANVYKVVDHSDSTSGVPITYLGVNVKSNSTDEPDTVNCIDEYRPMKCVTEEKERNLLIAETLAKEGFCDKKTVDENGNAVSTNLEMKRKPRRLKAKNDKNTILSQHIEGHRSDIAQDIDALMKYIESPTHRDEEKHRRHMQLSKSSNLVNKLHVVRDKSSENIRKGRKSKDSQFLKSNSLEEISVSKFEDLTSENTSTKLLNENKIVKSEKTSSWTKPGDRLQLNTESTAASSSTNLLRKDTDSEVQDAEFHTVTKKQKKRKASSFNRTRSNHYNGGNRQEYKPEYKSFYSNDNKHHGGIYSFKRSVDYQRRKSTSSVPSSDKSGESSDLDSVHSLPISSTKVTRSEIRSDSNTHTSYADITRTLPSPIRGINDENVYPIEQSEKTKVVTEECSSPESVQTVMMPLPKKRDKNICNPISCPQEYPPLSNSGKSCSNDMYVEFTLTVPTKEKSNQKPCVDVEETFYVKMPTTKVNEISSREENVSSKRPAVILMSELNDKRVVDDLEFGFEVNEQLLHGSISNDNEIPLTKTKECSTINVDKDICQKNYEAQVLHASKNALMEDVVGYIASDWDWVHNELGGKIQYFSP